MRSASVGLFVDRAISAQPGFRLTPAAVPSVVEICRRLDGVPLAIELAAARVRTMALADVAAGLDERFTLLTAGRRTEPATRHCSPPSSGRTTCSTRPSKRCSAGWRCSRRTFTLDDVERICTDVSIERGRRENRPAGARRQVDGRRRHGHVAHALLAPRDTAGLRPSTPRPRARRADKLEQRHAAHFVELATRGRRRARRSRRAAMDRSPRRTPSTTCRVAHRWATVQGDTDAALRLVAGAHEFAFRRMRYELFTWAEATLAELGDEEHPLAPLVLAIAGLRTVRPW